MNSTIQSQAHKEAANINRQNWKGHSYTIEFFKGLEAERQKIYLQCENLSVTVPVPTEQIVGLLIRAKQLGITISSYAKE